MLAPKRPRLVVQGPLPAPPGTAGNPPSAQEKRAAVRRFVDQVGGLENARRALEMLALLGFTTRRPGDSIE